MTKSLNQLAALIFFFTLAIAASAQPVGTKLCDSSGGWVDHNSCRKVMKYGSFKVLCPIDMYGRILTMPADCPRISGPDKIIEIPPEKDPATPPK